MTIEFMETHYAHLLDGDDAQELLGTSIRAGAATVGQIRRETKQHPKHASICVENDGSGFYIVDPPLSKFFAG